MSKTFNAETLAELEALRAELNEPRREDRFNEETLRELENSKE